MHIRLLGTAAGGGFPQWNCHCPTCHVARTDPARARTRTQSSVAVSADGERWFLLNASPDIRAQLATLPIPAPTLAPSEAAPAAPAPTSHGVRRVPFEAIVLTDAELDHTLGLALVRECRELRLYATGAIRDVLEADSRLLPLLRSFATVSLHPLSIGSRAELLLGNGTPSGLTVEAIPLAGHAPRFSTVTAPGVNCALIVRDSAGSSMAYVPCCAAIDGPLRESLATVRVLLFDGTFWSDRELIDLGISDRTATEMGHAPVGGAEGSLETLSGFTWCDRVFVHINNSNPMLVEDSPERRQVESAGFQVGFDGMELVC